MRSWAARPREDSPRNADRGRRTRRPRKSGGSRGGPEGRTTTSRETRQTRAILASSTTAATSPATTHFEGRVVIADESGVTPSRTVRGDTCASAQSWSVRRMGTGRSALWLSLRDGSARRPHGQVAGAAPVGATVELHPSDDVAGCSFRILMTCSRYLESCDRSGDPGVCDDADPICSLCD